jgi:hypothetical protein
MVLLALVEHRPVLVDYGRHPAARRVAMTLLKVFCGSGVLRTFGLICVALWSCLRGAL